MKKQHIIALTHTRGPHRSYGLRRKRRGNVLGSDSDRRGTHIITRSRTHDHNAVRLSGFATGDHRSISPSSGAAPWRRRQRPRPTAGGRQRAHAVRLDQGRRWHANMRRWLRSCVAAGRRRRLTRPQHPALHRIVLDRRSAGRNQAVEGRKVAAVLLLRRHRRW